METRHSGKKRQHISPIKSARSSLDFGRSSPSMKKRKMGDVAPRKPHHDPDDQETFTIHSFYGKREKNHFPHSPKRKKAAIKVLEKLSDENSDPDSDTVEKKITSSKRSAMFEFHSSNSADSSDTDTVNRPVHRKVTLTSNKKVPLNIKHIVNTPKGNSHQTPRRMQSYSTSKLPDRTEKLYEENVSTPVTSGKKFFKTRSPASADRCFGSIIIKKGFDVKFVPNRSAKKSDRNNNVKTDDRAKKRTPKSKRVDKKKATNITGNPFDKIGMQFMEVSNEENSLEINSYESQSLKPDGTTMTELDNTGESADEMDSIGENDLDELQTAGPNDSKTVKSVSNILKNKLDTEVGKMKDDSGLDTANSNDLFSSHSTGVSQNVGKTNNEDNEDTVSLISTVDSMSYTGSMDLFPMDSGMETPRSVITPTTEECLTPDNHTQVSADKESYISPSKEGHTQDISVQGSPSSTCSSSDVLSLVSEPKSPKTSQGQKLFPIFTSSKQSTPSRSSQTSKLRMRTSPGGSKYSPVPASQSPLLKYVRSKDSMEQMIIDAGQQRRYGATQCDVCGMVYTMSEPADETVHNKFHQSLLNALKFSGWKKERVVQEYVETGCRVIMVTAEDPKYATKKVEEINKIMGQELGFPEPTLTFRPAYKAFLFISEDKKIEGCCVCEPVTEGYRVLPESQGSQSSQNHPGQRPWCCSDVPVPASVGISRIWVYGKARRKGVATKLLDCVRQWSVYGIVIPRNKMAFSDPTPDGKILATNYTGTPTFLVYKYM